MKLCRFSDNRLGVVRGDHVLDVTAALEAIPVQRWPLAQGDPLMLHIDKVTAAATALLASARIAPCMHADERRIPAVIVAPGDLRRE